MLELSFDGRAASKRGLQAVRYHSFIRSIAVSWGFSTTETHAAETTLPAKTC
jgi:hypothetical protein